MSRLAVLHRERAALFAKLAELEAEIAAVHSEGETANDAQPATRKGPERPKGLPPRIRVPSGITPSETDQAKAQAALRRQGFRTRPGR